MNHSRKPGRIGRAISLAAAGGAVALALSGCAGSSTPAASSTDLTISIPAAPQGYNLPTNCGSPIFIYTYDSLIHVSPDGGYEPGIAESWEYGEGNTSFTLHLRDGVEFQDGTPVTAQSVVDTLEWLIDTPGINQGFLKNFSAVTATDESTVRIDLSQPYLNMEELLANGGMCNNGFPVSAAGLADPDAMGTETFGAGPYMLDESDTVPGDHYTLVKSDNYWDPEAQHWEKIVVRVISDSNTAFSALQTGQVDAVVQPPATLRDQAKSADLAITEGGSYGASLMLLDRSGSAVPAMADVRVRQAINFALDREALVSVLGDSWEPLVQFGLPNAAGYDESLESTYSYDPEKAKDLLTDAGYPDGFSMQIADLQNESGAPDTTQLVIQQLAAVGITASATTGKDVPTFVAAIQSKENAAIVFRVLGDVYFDATRLVIPPFNSVLDPFVTSDPTITAAGDALVDAPSDQYEQKSVELNAAITEQAFFANIGSSPQYLFGSKKIADLGDLNMLGVPSYLSWAPAG
jgi:peptide/nickel transport system substrate-binding protein